MLVVAIATTARVWRLERRRGGGRIDRPSPTTRRRRSSTVDRGVVNQRLPDPRPRRLVHGAGRQPGRRDARRATREGPVSRGSLPPRLGRRPNPAARARDLAGRPRSGRAHASRCPRAGSGDAAPPSSGSSPSGEAVSRRSSRRVARSTCSQALPKVDGEQDRARRLERRRPHRRDPRGGRAAASRRSTCSREDRRRSPEYAAQAPAELRPAIRRELGAVDPLRWVALARPGLGAAPGRSQRRGRPARGAAGAREGGGHRRRACAGTTRVTRRPGRRYADQLDWLAERSSASAARS